jgi:hypothetical protein
MYELFHPFKGTLKVFLLATTKASSILSVLNMHEDAEEDNEEAGVKVEEANGVSKF